MSRRRPTAADRARSRRSSAAHRARVAAGMRRYWLDAAAVEMMLVDGGWIASAEADSHERVEAALNRMIQAAISVLADDV